MVPKYSLYSYKCPDFHLWKILPQFWANKHFSASDAIIHVSLTCISPNLTKLAWEGIWRKEPKLCMQYWTKPRRSIPWPLIRQAHMHFRAQAAICDWRRKKITKITTGIYNLGLSLWEVQVKNCTAIQSSTVVSLKNHKSSSSLSLKKTEKDNCFEPPKVQVHTVCTAE